VSAFKNPQPNALEAVLLDALDSRRAASKGTFGFHGYLVDAPGFDAETFARLIKRALDEGVCLTPSARPGEFRAMRPSSPMTYHTTPTRCTCWAGQLGRPCKHRALACLLLAVTGTPSRGP